MYWNSHSAASATLLSGWTLTFDVLKFNTEEVLSYPGSCWTLTFDVLKYGYKHGHFNGDIVEH